jgi:hypothetical protein
MVAGAEANELPPTGRSVGASRLGTVPASGRAAKNSVAIRASVSGSGRPAGINSASVSGLADLGLCRDPSMSWLNSLVLIILSDLDVIEHGYCIVCKNRRRAVEGDQIGCKASIVYSHKAN